MLKNSSLFYPCEQKLLFFFQARKINKKDGIMYYDNLD